MAPATPALFKEQEVAFHMKLCGNVNGKKFEVIGKGAGDARIGKLKGKWIRTKTTEEKKQKIKQEDLLLPMSWAILAPTFAYGYKVYAKYPEDKVQFFQECFPEGYSQRRITRFGRMRGDDSVEEEGVMTTDHEVILREGVYKGAVDWICHNIVTLTANFREGSCLLEKNSCSVSSTMELQSLERCMPCADGVKQYVQYFYPINPAEGEEPSGDYIIATQMTHNRPLCSHCSHLRKDDPMYKCEHNRDVPLPEAHYKRTECKQWRDPEEPRDHVLQDEVNHYFSFNRDGIWAEIGMPENERPKQAEAIAKAVKAAKDAKDAEQKALEDACEEDRTEDA